MGFSVSELADIFRERNAGVLLATEFGSWPPKSWLFSKPNCAICRIGVESYVQR
jgi:hypothetical protein